MGGKRGWDAGLIDFTRCSLNLLLSVSSDNLVMFLITRSSSLCARRPPIVRYFSSVEDIAAGGGKIKPTTSKAKVPGSDSPKKNMTELSSWNNLGIKYNNEGNYPKALEYFEKCLAIQLKTSGAEHSDVGTSYNNLGNVHNSQGDYPKALEYHEKCLAISLKTLGAEHPNTKKTQKSVENVKAKLERRENESTAS